MKRYAFILLNLEKFCKRLCSQNRADKHAHAFIRRGVVGPKNAKLLFFYVTHPHKDIRGYADFIERVTGDAEDLWKSLGHESLLNSYDEYKDFLSSAYFLSHTQNVYNLHISFAVQKICKKL